MKLSKKIRHFLISEEGFTMVKYAVMLALIILACIGTFIELSR